MYNGGTIGFCEIVFHPDPNPSPVLQYRNAEGGRITRPLGVMELSDNAAFVLFNIRSGNILFYFPDNLFASPFSSITSFI